MGAITLVVLGLTLANVLFGALTGFLRGRERALLRLALVVLSAILAISLRGTIVDFLMNANIGGASLKETLMESFLSTDGAIPASLMNLVFSLIEIFVGFIAYFILLFAFRLFTLVFVFPFLKILIKKVEIKRAMKCCEESTSQSAESTPSEKSENTESLEESNSENTESDAAPIENADIGEQPNSVYTDYRQFIKKRKGMGALVGLVQGFLFAYLFFAPLTGLVMQIDSITSMEIGGEPVVEVPEEVGISEYANSGIGKFYSSTGRWCYNMLTSTTDANGNKVSLGGIMDSVGVILEVADVATTLEDDIKILTDENAAPEEVIDALDSLGDKLISVGGSMEKLDEGTVDMIKDLVTDFGGEDIPQEDIDEILEKLEPEFFVAAGNGVKAFAEYEKIKLNGEELTEDKAKDIIEKAKDCMTIVESIGTVDIGEADKEQFKTAIDSVGVISKEDKDSLYKLFGIQTPSMP